MNKVFKSAILMFVVSAFLGCSDLSNPEVDTGESADGTEVSSCEGCAGNSQLLAIVPTTTSYEIYSSQLVQTISGKCNDGQFPSSYLTWEMIDDSTQAVVKTSATVFTDNFKGETIEFVDGEGSVDGVYYCKQGRFLMDVEMPYVGPALNHGGLNRLGESGKTFTIKVYLFGLDKNNKKYPASISRNYRLIPKS